MLILDDPTTWPLQITEQLDSAAVVELLQRHEFMDHVADDPALIDVFVDIEEHATAIGLAGYHCTKQLANRPYAETGLRILDFQTHHSDFRVLLRDHKSVDGKLYAHIDNRLYDWQANHTGKRERMLWFCLNRRLVLDPGTESLFKYYGGEAIYFAFMKDPLVAPFLEDLGDPVVVEAWLATSDITVFREFAFGRTLVSYFANTLNPDFLIEDLEGYVSSNISADNIAAVYPHAKYVAMVAQNAASKR